MVTGSGIFGVLGPGLCGLGGWCPRRLLRGASPASLEEPASPQTLAAAQEVAGAHGAGQRRLSEETQAQDRAAVATEQGLCVFQARPKKDGVGRGPDPHVQR